ncbi:GLIPR1-like protein 1 [Erinaceus europaeus]|uniref:GLIPR1-like protein 1 n=1 Tax=Erinaceus europaeus TaxID=9365 RepID=A0ABM3XKV4_ERIEU|nr:GLIPR1-like protein 1 [Erinaceus europaeus]
MVSKKKWSCWWIINISLQVSQSALNIPLITDPRFIDNCVKAHNKVRAMVSPTAANMKTMSWDHELATLAKSWAMECKFRHNSCLALSYKCGTKYQFVGENIWLGPLRKFTADSAVVAWYNETVFYDYYTHKCSKVCGHYTQVVWANTNKVGCALAMCPNLAGEGAAIFVCDYGPPGNYLRTFPYINGKTCSLCDKDETCVKKLCQRSAKPAETSNSRPSSRPQGSRPAKGSASQQKACSVLALYLLSIFL